MRIPFRKKGILVLTKYIIMLNISVSNEIKSACPIFMGAAIYANITNTQYDQLLWDEINLFINEYAANNTFDSIKKTYSIAATREVYKKLGKDPNRYRPSSESLLRRIVKDMPLYQIDTLVDLVNLVSIKSGYSIGGFDYSKIEGNQLILGVGKADELYEGIGRGMLNIEGLPVYRDNIGGIGTPTSDHERTKININTTQFLGIINGYSGQAGLEEAADHMKYLLEKYVSAKDISINFFD